MPSRTQAGFTLLEVLCAFAILSVVTALMTQIISHNVDKAYTAIQQRELRELADTVFGKILFEQTEHRDGDSGSMAEDYGRWAGLDQARADRYRVYRWSLEKREMVAAGVVDGDADKESLFGDRDQEGTESAVPSTATEGEAEKGSISLVRFTMRVFHEDQPDAPLITLTRYLKPPDIPGVPVR